MDHDTQPATDSASARRRPSPTGAEARRRLRTGARPTGARERHDGLYCVVPAAGGGLGPYITALARKLEELLAGDEVKIVIVSGRAQESAYVQCLVPHAPGAWVEAVSNEFLSGRWALTDERVQALVDGGWSAPGSSAADGRPNWWMAWPQPVDPSSLAALMVMTLHDVYGLGEDEEWCLEVLDGPCDGCW